MALFTRRAASLLLSNLCPLLLFVNLARAQDCASPEVETAKKEIVGKIAGPLNPVRLSRREDLEDSILHVAPKQTSNLKSPVLIYEVQTPSFAVVKGDVVQITCNDACDFHRFVAVSADGRTSYQLTGFPGALDEFNRMAKNSELYVGNQSDAQTYAGFCLDMAFGIPPSQWTIGESDAILHAVRYYQSSGARNSLDKAKSWWNRASHARQRTPLDVQVTGSPIGFNVAIPVFSVYNDEPSVKLFRLSISTRGECARLPD